MGLAAVHSTRRKLIVAASFTLNLAILFYYKYFNFILGLVAKALALAVPHKHKLANMHEGRLLMLWGCFLKIVLADRIAVFVVHVYGNYQDFGGCYLIAAYNLAGNGCTIPSAYWVLVNALDYQEPEIVVMDVFDMWPGRIVSDRYGQVHEQFDAFPLSVHKAQMVLDLFKDPTLTDRNGNNLYEKKWEFFWNLGEYHSRWASLGEEDFAGERPVYDEQAKEYLEKIIDLCDDRGIQLILVNTGFDCKDEAKLFQDSFDVREESLLEEEKVKRLVENLGERVEAWKADEWDVADWGAEALDLEPSDTADLIIAVYSKHDGKVVDVRGF